MDFSLPFFLSPPSLVPPPPDDVPNRFPVTPRPSYCLEYIFPVLPTIEGTLFPRSGGASSNCGNPPSPRVFAPVSSYKKPWLPSFFWVLSPSLYAWRPTAICTNCVLHVLLLFFLFEKDSFFFFLSLDGRRSATVVVSPWLHPPPTLEIVRLPFLLLLSTISSTSPQAPSYL